MIKPTGSQIDDFIAPWRRTARLVAQPFRAANARGTAGLKACATVTILLAVAWAFSGVLGGSSMMVGASVQPAGAVATEEVNAIQCWRRVSRNAVYIGEHFTVTLTCSVIETESARAVPDEVRLEPETIDVSPFDVVEGRRYADVRRGPRRFLQYQYTLRLIGDEFFGTDVAIPALDLTYRIDRTIDGGSAQQGRELTYILPAEPVRVLSLVPAEMADIRELASGSFGEVETRLFRARLTALAAALVGIVAVACLLLAALQFRRERRGALPVVDQPLPASVIVRRVLGELKALARLSQDHGWNAELVGRALAAFRLAGAVTLSRPIAQTVVDAESTHREGQLRVRRGVWRPKMIAISSALTPDAMTRQIDTVRSNPRADDRLIDLADEVRDALALFTTARYSQTGDLPTDELTGELDNGITAARQLWIRTVVPVRRAGGLMRAAGTWWRQVWPR